MGKLGVSSTEILFTVGLGRSSAHVCCNLSFPEWYNTSPAFTCNPLREVGIARQSSLQTSCSRNVPALLSDLYTYPGGSWFGCSLRTQIVTVPSKAFLQCLGGKFLQDWQPDFLSRVNSKGVSVLQCDPKQSSTVFSPVKSMCLERYKFF